VQPEADEKRFHKEITLPLSSTDMRRRGAQAENEVDPIQTAVIFFSSSIQLTFIFCRAFETLMAEESIHFASSFLRYEKR
jgi:hypothetical protein